MSEETSLLVAVANLAWALILSHPLVSLGTILATVAAAGMWACSYRHLKKEADSVPSED